MLTCKSSLDIWLFVGILYFYLPNSGFTIMSVCPLGSYQGSCHQYFSFHSCMICILITERLSPEFLIFIFKSTTAMSKFSITYTIWSYAWPILKIFPKNPYRGILILSHLNQCKFSTKLIFR